LLVEMRALRQAAGISQRKAAELMGIDDNTYIRAEGGEAPSLAIALKIARFMQRPVEEIWGLEE
jgi:DNA-binding XRE family transcriptional regulator